MKKNILGLLILSSLPLFSTISNFNATKNIEAVIKQPIKKEATKIQEQYYLSQNPNDTNRPYEFEKAINSSQMVSKTSIKGSLEYTFSSNYIGYTNSFEGFIQINYKQNDDFWNASIANPPGYGRPKTLATLSRLSPKASSNVSPIISKDK